MRTTHDGVADAECATLDDDGGERAAADFDLGLDDDAGGLGLGVGLELEHVGLKENHVEQIGNAGAFDGGNGHGDGFATPVFGSDVAFLHLLLHALDVGTLNVHFVHGDHQGDGGILGMLKSFVRLRHKAVVGGDHQNCDVGDIGTAGAHLGEGCVAGRVEESDLTVRVFDLISTDVLGNTTGFTGGDVGLADGVEERGFTVVNVTENTNDGRTRGEVLHLGFGSGLFLALCFFFGGLLGLLRGFAAVFDLQHEAMLLGDLYSNRLFDRLIHRREDSHLHEFGNELERLHPECGRKIANNDRGLEMNDLDVALGGDGRSLRGRRDRHRRIAGRRNDGRGGFGSTRNRQRSTRCGNRSRNGRRWARG